MTTVLEVTETVQNGVLKVVETSGQWTLGALRTTASAFDGVAPAIPALPYADKLPTPEQVVDTSFRFAERLLGAQRSFVAGLAALAVTDKPAH